MNQSYNNRRPLSNLFLLTTAIILLSSCSKAFRFNSSTIVPAANGKVSVSQDRNKNYQLKIKVKNLAPSESISRPGSAYVVWLETKDNGTKNIGKLRSSKKLFSPALKASLTTVSPYEPVRVFITAENDPNIQYPGYSHVLETDRMN